MKKKKSRYNVIVSERKIIQLPQQKPAIRILDLRGVHPDAVEAAGKMQDSRAVLVLAVAAAEVLALPAAFRVLEGLKLTWQQRGQKLIIPLFQQYGTLVSFTKIQNRTNRNIHAIEKKKKNAYVNYTEFQLVDSDVIPKSRNIQNSPAATKYTLTFHNPSHIVIQLL